MSKILKPLMIFLLVGVLLFAFYYLTLRPSGFTSESEVVEAFLNDLDDSNCDEYFVNETRDVCINFVTLLKNEDISVIEVSNSGGRVTADITVNEIEVTFVFEVVGVDPGGLKGILTKYYYYIDTIIE